MIIQNVYIVGHDEKSKDIQISNSTIFDINDHNSKLTESYIKPPLIFDRAIAFPGLINSHDHLDFNLYPALGHKKYRSYLEWSRDIHVRDQKLIQAIKKIPVSLRLRWGIYKNLIAGVTTVMHHGRHYESLNNALIDIIPKCQSFHSVKLEKWWRWRLNLPLKHLADYNRCPVVIHIGEGTNKESQYEIDELLYWNFFRRKLIGVHALAMNESQANFFEALVWCPVSNLFLFSETAKINLLKKHTKILLGTDSTLTADWNIWTHLRLARELKMLSDETLFNSITQTAASVWRLKDSGSIKKGNRVDLVIANRKSQNIWDSFYSTTCEDILLVLKKGRILLFDAAINKQLATLVQDSGSFSRVNINGREKYVLGDIKALIHSIQEHYPDIKLPISYTE
jgi:cytosine/adenosine deaminase-related metal-dependent hydrolase